MSFIYQNEEFDNSLKNDIQNNESSYEKNSNNDKSYLKISPNNKTFIQILYDAIEIVSCGDIKYNKSYRENKKKMKIFENKLMENKNDLNLNSKSKLNSINSKLENQANINNSEGNLDFQKKLYLISFESKEGYSISKNKSNNKSIKKNSEINNKSNLYQNNFNSEVKNSEINDNSNDLKSEFKNSEINNKSNFNQNTLKKLKNKSKMKNKKLKEQFQKIEYPKNQIDITPFFTSKEIEELEGKKELINESNYKDLIMQKKKEKELFFEYLENTNKLNENFLSNEISNNYSKQMLALSKLYKNKIILFDNKKLNFETDYIQVLNRIVKNYRKNGITKQDREIHEEINSTFNSFFHNYSGRLINIKNLKIVEDVINGKIKLEELNNIKFDDLLEVYKLKKCETLEINYIEKEWKFIIDYFKIIKSIIS